MNRAVFLDRDGTVIEEREYLHRVEDVALLPGAGMALGRLQEGGFRLIFLTNQSGVGRGYFTMTEVEAVHAHLLRILAGDGVRIDRVYIAPEAPDQPSLGRKPSPHFLFQARDELQLSLGDSFMIGDKLIDLQCGWNAGLKQSILVRTGYGAREEREHAALLARALVVDDLAAAAARILDQVSR
jgi:D-glycero-D-manno-heptose 1,7-bisphosphate phosphatase